MSTIRNLLSGSGDSTSWSSTRRLPIWLSRNGYKFYAQTNSPRTISGLPSIAVAVCLKPSHGLIGIPARLVPQQVDDGLHQRGRQPSCITLQEPQPASCLAMHFSYRFYDRPHVFPYIRDVYPTKPLHLKSTSLASYIYKYPSRWVSGRLSSRGVGLRVVAQTVQDCI